MRLCILSDHLLRLVIVVIDTRPIWLQKIGVALRSAPGVDARATF